jgi:hypothetical protein
MRNKNTTIRIIALALIVFSLIATTATIAEDRTPQPEYTVPVQFNSKPDNCELWLNGEFVGSADLGLRLKPGKHVVEMRRDGYEAWRRELSVMRGNPTRVVGLLKPLPRQSN